MQKRPFGLVALACAGLLGAGAMAVAAQAAPEKGDVVSADAPGMPAEGAVKAVVPGPPPEGAVKFHERIDPEEMAERRDEFHADLAEELGVTAEEVEQAFQAVFEKRLDEAVADGHMTREQADEILKAKESGIPPGPMVGLHMRGEAPGEGAPPPPPPLP